MEQIQQKSSAQTAVKSGQILWSIKGIQQMLCIDTKAKIVIILWSVEGIAEDFTDFLAAVLHGVTVNI